MTNAQEIHVPGLATIELQYGTFRSVAVTIRLDPAHLSDLNDLFAKKIGPDGIYLQGDDMSLMEHPKMAKFMEVLSLWDEDHDGVPDFHWVRDMIDDALWRADDQPKVFHRPRRGIYTKAVMWIMPPPPEHHIVFSFGSLNVRYRKNWRLHLRMLGLMGVVFGLIQLQVWLFPVLRYSVVSGFFALADRFGISMWIALGVFVGLFNLLRWFNDRVDGKAGERSISRHTYGFFSGAAIWEEQAFREGAENWTRFQRIRSHAAFGAIHMVNLIYPLATILPLAVGGAFFMWRYLRTMDRVAFRRTAVLEAAVWHRVYNRVVMFAVGGSLVVFFGIQALALLGVVALTLIAPALLDLRLKLQERFAEQQTVSVNQ